MAKDTDNSRIVDDIYTDLSSIEEELAERRKNANLVRLVEDFLGDYLPNEFKLEPRAVISRPIITPNREFRYFMDLNSELSLNPLGLEYHDKFVAKNPDKYHLAKLYFAKEREDGSQFMSSERILDFNHYEGKNFKDIKTLNGVPLIDFHHNLLFEEFPVMKDKILDISSWFKKTRNLSSYYYLYFLSLFICHGALFENYLLEEEGEQDFFMEKVYPSFREATRIFGVKPLIFPLLPIEYEKGKQWMCYGDDLRSSVKDKLGISSTTFSNKQKQLSFVK